MNLQEFKTALESDATKHNKVQEQTIKDMRERIIGLEQEIVIKDENLAKAIGEKDKWIAQLERRCMVMSSGAFCIFCGHKSTCAARKS